MQRKRRKVSSKEDSYEIEFVQDEEEPFVVDLLKWDGNNEPFQSVRHKQEKLTPLPPGSEYQVRVTIRPHAYRSIMPDDYFGIKLHVDGEEVGMRFLERNAFDWSDFSARDADSTYTFLGVNNHKFKTEERNDPTGAASVNWEQDMTGSIEVYFYHARRKEEDLRRRQLKEREAFGGSRLHRRIRMTPNEKLYHGVLQTKEGEQYRESNAGRRVGVSPAVIVEEEPLARCTVFYDTPENLRHRGVLLPMRITEHRQFFPDRDWLALQRKINRNLRRLEQAKRRAVYDLTGGRVKQYIEPVPEQDRKRRLVSPKSESMGPTSTIGEMSGMSDEENWERVYEGADDSSAPMKRRVKVTSNSRSQISEDYYSPSEDENSSIAG